MSLNQLIAISIDPSTEKGALAAAGALRRVGLRAEVFLNASSGDHFESIVMNEPLVQAVIDYSLSDLAATRHGLLPEQSPERMTAATRRSLPQVIVPGGLDHVIKHGSHQDVTLSRPSKQISETTTLFRTSPEDNDAFGKELAFKASASAGPVVFVFPRGGLSQWDRDEGPDYDFSPNRALLDSLHLWKRPDIELIESHRHINDPLFAQIVVDQLLKLMVVRH